MSNGIIRRLSEVLGMADRGRFEASCNEALEEAITALKEQPGEKGKATITIELEVVMKNEMVQITPKLKVKTPDGQSFAPLVLWEHEGGLSTQHPSQIGMFDAGGKLTTIDKSSAAGT